MANENEDTEIEFITLEVWWSKRSLVYSKWKENRYTGSNLCHFKVIKTGSWYMGFKQACTISRALQLNQRENFLLLRYLQPPVQHDHEKKIAVSGVYQSYCAIGSMGSCTGPKGHKHLWFWTPERWPQKGAGTGKGSHPMQRNGEIVLQRETGRVGSPDPKQSESEGSSDWKTDHKINSRNRKRLVHSVIVLMQNKNLPINRT